MAGTAQTHVAVRSEIDVYGGVGINDAGNGVWIRQDLHRCHHTANMYNLVGREVESATSNFGGVRSVDSMNTLIDAVQDLGRQFAGGFRP